MRGGGCAIFPRSLVFAFGMNNDGGFLIVPICFLLASPERPLLGRDDKEESLFSDFCRDSELEGLGRRLMGACEIIREAAVGTIVEASVAGSLALIRASGGDSVDTTTVTDVVRLVGGVTSVCCGIVSVGIASEQEIFSISFDGGRGVADASRSCIQIDMDNAVTRKAMMPLTASKINACCGLADGSLTSSAALWTDKEVNFDGTLETLVTRNRCGFTVVSTERRAIFTSKGQSNSIGTACLPRSRRSCYPSLIKKDNSPRQAVRSEDGCLGLIYVHGP